MRLCCSKMTWAFAAIRRRARVHVDAALSQTVDLAQQGDRIDRHTRADHVDLPGVEDPGGDQVQDPLHAVDDDGVTGVGAPW